FAAVHRLLGRRHLVALGSVIALAAFLVVGISSLASAVGEKSAAGGRLMAAGQEAQQSFGFRQQLWKDTIKMAQAYPAFGSGAGTFGEEIQNFTATEGSVVAHNSYLQMAAESGVPAAILLLLIAGVWFVAVLRRHEGMPAEINLLRMGIAAGVVAAGANLVVESSLSYFGFATALFAFLGIGLLLAVDGVAPERAPLLSRAFGAGLISLAALYYLVVVAVSQYQMSVGLYALREGRIDVGERRLRSAVSATPLASQPHAELSRVDVAMRRPEEAVAGAHKAVDLAPTPKHLFILGEAYEASGQLEDARQAYATAAQQHKSSYSLRRYLDFLVEHGRMADAEATAKDLITAGQAEAKAVSALPWLVGTDAVDAHIFLANRAGGRGDKKNEIALLSGARDILREYETKTLPELLRVTGLTQVEEDRDALSRKLGRRATDADVALERGMTLEELQQFVEQARSFKLAGESVDGAEKLVDIRKKIEIRLDSIQRAAS
ncbi:MAG: O-antigen ligase family protein, partial [Armatimonadetes bacterium]|nr:O-antigen ligase family protein [Armatimonadota bacterium]